MRLTPRRLLLHIIIVLVTLALPLLVPSSCGPVVHSGGSPDGRNLKLTHLCSAKTRSQQNRAVDQEFGGRRILLTLMWRR